MQGPWLSGMEQRAQTGFSRASKMSLGLLVNLNPTESFIGFPARDYQVNAPCYSCFAVTPSSQRDSLTWNFSGLPVF